jgi:hypothetical protein
MPRDNGPIALTLAEIRHLIDILLIGRPRNPLHLLHWSTWRRRHQGAARQAHYRRRLANDLSP